MCRSQAGPQGSRTKESGARREEFRDHVGFGDHGRAGKSSERERVREPRIDTDTDENTENKVY